MNKTKTILAGFAVFASIILLSATCIAGPVQEKVSIEAVEYSEQELAIISLIQYLESSHSRDMQNIVAESDELIELSTAFNLLPSSPTQGHWGGFLRNMAGEMYIPGTGWIVPDEFWLGIEEFLQVLPLADALAILDQIEDSGPEPATFIIIGILLIFILILIESGIEIIQVIVSAIAELFAGLFDLLGDILIVWVLASLLVWDLALEIFLYILQLLFPWYFYP